MEYSIDKSSYKLIPVQSGYIKPGEPYDVIIENAVDFLEDGDFLVVSETPLAVSQGRLVDEAEFKPSFSAYILADLWSKYLWGYILGPLLGIKKRTIKNLRKLPPEARSHKEVILNYYGWKHALKPASEAGVDLSNAPGTCVSLLPHDPQSLSKDMAAKIKSICNKNVTVMVIDTDATYKIGKMKFTSLPISIKEIRNNWGIFGYLLGRLGNIIGPTPLGVSKHHELDEIFQIAQAAEECQKIHENSMETVYEMQELLDGDVTTITIDMLDSIIHSPAIIVRKS
ncbi:MULTISPECIES: coenzyme F420-0:L-glutamate ligase [Methanobacterium]|uniref:Gamma-glutamyl ligase n=1 Tax=Methanobacterium subterraneum TaxID=59277 RepID=A0A7K4DLM9_9EURY|nr:MULTISPECIES: coenzyme F420-0:L-glutamate ligase [Methanobacterium]MBW4256941.1 coenzyme F420-0:L-glutamate ligase [Methanobacterium sp. YSL]NMO09258.1 gamma-glutamyl ligase [Methanobacterium subterraneum]